MRRTGSPSSIGSESRSSTPAPSAASKPIESEEEKERHKQANDCLGVLESVEADTLDLDLH